MSGAETKTLERNLKPGPCTDFSRQVLLLNRSSQLISFHLCRLGFRDLLWLARLTCSFKEIASWMAIFPRASVFLVTMNSTWDIAFSLPMAVCGLSRFPCLAIWRILSLIDFRCWLIDFKYWLFSNSNSDFGTGLPLLSCGREPPVLVGLAQNIMPVLVQVGQAFREGRLSIR